MCYYSFNRYLQDRYGTRVHRLSLDAGFTCPNRDGTLDDAGCIYCNEGAFVKYAGQSVSLSRQIEESMAFAGERFKAEKFIAYFQASSGTYASPDELKEKYDIIKGYPDVVGLFISTRPDCVDDEKLSLIESYKKDYEVWIEYGLQTVHERTLKEINRRHTFTQTGEAIRKTHTHGIKTAVHVILGLPGETGSDMIETARAIGRLGVSGVKLHTLHVLKGTKLDQLYKEGRVSILSQGEYVSLACDFLENLPEECVIFRLASSAEPDLLVAPGWMNDRSSVIDEIKKEFTKRGTRQGSSTASASGT